MISFIFHHFFRIKYFVTMEEKSCLSSSIFDEVPLIRPPVILVFDICDHSVFEVEFSSEGELLQQICAIKNTKDGFVMKVPEEFTDKSIKYFFIDFNKLDQVSENPKKLDPASVNFVELKTKWNEIVEPFFKSFSVSLNGEDAKKYKKALALFIDWCKKDAEFNMNIVHCVKAFYDGLSESFSNGNKKLCQFTKDVECFGITGNLEIGEIGDDVSIPRSFLGDCLFAKASGARVPLKSLIKQRTCPLAKDDIAKVRADCKECRIQLNDIYGEPLMASAESELKSTRNSCKRNIERMNELGNMLMDPTLDKSVLSVDDAQNIIAKKTSLLDDVSKANIPHTELFKYII